MDGILNIRSGLWVALVTSLFAGMGCRTVAPQRSLDELTSSAHAESAIKRDVYQLVIQAHNSQPRVTEKPLSGNKHLQEVLAENKAFRHFNRSEIELQRKLPNGGYHRMPIEHSVATSRVDPEFDYVLHPGDRVVVREDPKTLVDDMLDGALKPLGLDRSTKPQRDPMTSKYRFVN